MSLEPSDRKRILDAIHSVQDADACLLGRDGMSEAFKLHRAAIKSLMQALGIWKGDE